MQIPVFVINLKSSVERKKSIVKQLAGMGVSFRLFEAIPPEDVELDNNLLFDKYAKQGVGILARRLIKTEFGCALSHLRVFEKIVADGIECACILEDDAILSQAFCKVLNSEPLMQLKWGLIYLGHHGILGRGNYQTGASCTLPVAEISGFSLTRPLELPFGTYGYLITRNTAFRLLQKAFPIRMPMDIFLGSAEFLKINVLNVIPPLVTPDLSFESTICNRSLPLSELYCFSRLHKNFQILKKCFPIIKTAKWELEFIVNWFLTFLRRRGFFRYSYVKKL